MIHAKPCALCLIYMISFSHYNTPYEVYIHFFLTREIIHLPLDSRNRLFVSAISDVCVCESINWRILCWQGVKSTRGRPNLIMFPTHEQGYSIQLCRLLTAWMNGDVIQPPIHSPSCMLWSRACLLGGRKGHLFLIYSRMYTGPLLLQTPHNKRATQERNLGTLGYFPSILASWDVHFFTSPFSIMHLGIVP